MASCNVLPSMIRKWLGGQGGQSNNTCFPDSLNEDGRGYNEMPNTASSSIIRERRLPHTLLFLYILLSASVIKIYGPIISKTFTFLINRINDLIGYQLFLSMSVKLNTGKESLGNYCCSCLLPIHVIKKVIHITHLYFFFLFLHNGLRPRPRCTRLRPQLRFA